MTARGLRKELPIAGRVMAKGLKATGRGLKRTLAGAKPKVRKESGRPG